MLVLGRTHDRNWPGDTTEREIANIDEFQVDENGIPLFPAGLKEEANLYVLPDGRYLPCGVYRTEDGGSLIYEPSELSFFGQMLAQFKER